MANASLAVLLHSETLILMPLVIDLHLLVIDLQAGDVASRGGKN